MGKRKSGTTHSNTLSDDDNLAVSSDKLLRSFLKNPTTPPKLHLEPPQFNLRPVEDRRTWHPDKSNRPPQATQRHHRALKIPEGSKSPTATKASPAFPYRLQFSSPKHVTLCVRRRIRKEVLFALRKTRKGAGSKRRRNQWSEIKC